MEPEPIAAGTPTGAEEDGLAESMKPSSWTTGSAVDAPPGRATAGPDEEEADNQRRSRS